MAIENDNTQCISYLKQMLKLQTNINQSIHPDWRNQHYAWYRAIWTECAELMDHISWKWWKHNPPNLTQIHLEIVDIWHFGLSDCLQNSEDENTIAHALGNSALNLHELNTPTGPVSAADLYRIDLLNAVERLARDCLSLNRFPLGAFSDVINHALLSLPELFRLYVGKNVLNQFRQDFGYQTGNYQKRWDNKEDNEHLSDILSKLDPSHEGFKQQVYDRLKQCYPKAVAEPL